MRYSAKLYWFPVVVTLFSALIIAIILYVSKEMSRTADRSDFISGISMHVHSMEGKLHGYRQSGDEHTMKRWSQDLTKLSSDIQLAPDFPAEQQTLFNSIRMGSQSLTVLTEWLTSENRLLSDRKADVRNLMLEKLFTTTETIVWDIYLLEQLEKKEILAQSRKLFSQVSGLLVVCAVLFLVIALRISRQIKNYLSAMHHGLKQVESEGFGESIDIAYRSDEFSEFIRAFNELSEKLKDTMVTKNELEEIVEKKTFMLNHLANTDPLTQVSNRRKFMQQGQKELARAIRYQTPLSIIMVDGDDFKMINDKYGHHVGDEVLINLCRIFEQEIREIDTLARWGGEEFVILLPQTDNKGATDIAQRICDEVARDPLRISNMLIDLTVSIGVASKEEDSELDTIIDRADGALYCAKEQGKNRVSVHTQS